MTATETLLRFFSTSPVMHRTGQPNVCDFLFGNPHEMPLTPMVETFQKWIMPQHKDWYAYQNNHTGAQEAIAATLRERYAMPFEPADIYLTTGAFAGLALLLGALTDTGDEVIFNSPPWFFYEPMILHYGATPIRVKVDRQTFDLDLRAIADAITPRTRAIIVNSPNNPTGKIYPPETLKELARILTAASERNGRSLYLLSDEAYSHILFDGRAFPTPTAFYPHSFLIYTYGKTLLIPGQRIGYVAMPPTMPQREQLRSALFFAQVATGWVFPNAPLQYAVPELEKLSIDVGQLHHKRDHMVGALREMGYAVHAPEGTFYLLVSSPWTDDQQFCELLAEHDVLCLPGTVFELPGHFRISLTANNDMIQRALPGFAAAKQKAGGMRA
jgi:aspartate aminotransferase